MAKEKANWKLLKNKQVLGNNFPKWFLNILSNRGVEKGGISDYLEPKYGDIADYQNFKDIDKAVKRVVQAKSEEEQVCIYGDYDVDGTTAVALISDVLNKIGIQNVKTYIPHRGDEGYGLNTGAVKKLKKEGVNLIITVDCGIASKDIIDVEKEIDFIVIDHHEIDKEKLPIKSINIHPSLTKDKKEYKLSGCGMAFHLARALYAEYKDSLGSGQEKWLLDLVALSTICDIVPLIGDNRILATWGLEVIKKTKREGIKALAKVASVNLDDIGSYEVGFILGPRLNAAGRLEHAKLALELLITDDSAKAQTVAKKLNELNIERQKMCKRIIEEAKEEVENGGKKDHEIYLLSNKNWPRGVVGIVASRISDEYNKPVIVFENDGELHHGSARSIEGFNIVEALGECDECLEKFGGHAKAAGVTVTKEHFVAFSDKLLTVAKNKIKETDLKKTIEIDTEIGLKEINDDALNLLNKMEPLGYGNSRPAFILEGVQVENIKRVGGGKEHLKFTIDSTSIGGIAFNEECDLKEGQKYDIVGTLKYNIWNNRKSIEFRMVDFRENK